MGFRFIIIWFIRVYIESSAICKNMRSICNVKNYVLRNGYQKSILMPNSPYDESNYIFETYDFSEILYDINYTASFLFFVWTKRNFLHEHYLFRFSNMCYGHWSIVLRLEKIWFSEEKSSIKGFTEIDIKGLVVNCRCYGLFYLMRWVFNNLISGKL